MKTILGLITSIQMYLIMGCGRKSVNNFYFYFIFEKNPIGNYFILFYFVLFY